MPAATLTADPHAQQRVFKRLNAPIKTRDDLLGLFVHDLGFERIEQSIPPREETFGRGEALELARRCRPLRLAGHDDFQILYAELDGPRLDYTRQRALATQLLKTFPDALFVFARQATLANADGAEIHLVNVKADTPADRRVFRRFRLGPGEHYRTAAERLALLDLTAAPHLTTLDLRDRLDAAFDVEAVTKQFYQEIANWYFWARDCRDVAMPKDVQTDEDRALFLIRLLTRLIFCWFLRRKRHPQTGVGLLPDTLFEEAGIRELVKDASPDACTYYPAILQNLFFATLNTEMDKPDEPPTRRFVDEGDGQRSDDHMIHTVWRNARLLRDPEAFAALLRRVPFLNGGLFECLDDRVQKGNSAFTEEIRIDGFSNDPKKQPKLPNFLFFGPEQVVNLSDAYGDPSRRRETVRPLLSILSSYNFTLTENTPLEQEVALDPELLGHVFENLLAAYNPETGVVARNATGSFYTPRVVVDWMVDQALLVYFGKALARANRTIAADQADKRLRELLSWEDIQPRFSPAETEALIDAIDHLKALDPACGSGAFPMGLLQKLVHVLRKLDPENKGWRRRQEAALDSFDSATAREEARKAIERAFARDNDDYGRKLYLIENCLYGVDIQPIACQIAKLRFFISLICDQAIDPTEPNYGILPLPNLETKIVAANTLIGIERPAQQMLRNPEIDAKEAELRQVRERHFTARTPATKARCRELDAKLRAEISQLLRADGFPRETTEKLANWNPYDQNASADFFDPEWMFGIRDGFDIVIGNPPYLFGEHLRNQKQLYADHYELARGQFDAYWLFYERAMNGLLQKTGVLCLINSDAMLARDETARLRRWLFQAAGFLLLSHVGQVFGGVGVSAVVVLAIKGGGPLTEYTVVDYDENTRSFGNTIPVNMSGIVQDPKLRLHCTAQGDIGLAFLSRQRATFADCFDISRGEELGKKHLSRLVALPVPQGCVPILAGEGVTRFCQPRATHFVRKSEVAKPLSIYRSPKIVVVKTGQRFVAAVDNDGLVTLQSIYNLHPKAGIRCELGCALLNSKLLNVVLRHKITGQKKLFPQITQSNVLEMPVPDMTPQQQSIIVALVHKILAAKRADPLADVTALEREIDQHVYRLYGLTADEIKIVEEGAR
jgi:hypothetical protein